MKCCEGRAVYAEIPRSRIALFRFVFEGYGHLAIMSVVDRYRAVIKLRCTSDAEEDVRALLRSLEARIVKLPG